MTKANLAQVTNGTLGLLRALKHTFGIPRGLLAIFTITFLYIFPYEIVRILFSKNKLDILSRVTVRAIRYALGDGNVPKNRFIYGLLDQIYHFTTYMQGYTLTRNQSLIVKNTDVPSEIKGLWILDKNKSVPSFQSPEWDQKLVVFWIHGGGFCSGSPSTFTTFHAQVIQAFNTSPLNKKRTELIYFCVDYPIAPEADVRKMRAYCLKALTWLRTTVGAKSVVVGGDSAGGTLALHVLSDMPQSAIHGAILFSPWLDLSLSYPDKQTLKRLSETTDFLNLSMGRQWSDLAVFGSSVDSEEAEKMKKSHQISPFFGPTPILPHPMVVYSRHEVFGPSIEDFVIRLQKKQDLRAIAGEGLPHDYPLFGSFPPFGSMYQECKAVVEEVVKHLLEDFMAF